MNTTKTSKTSMEDLNAALMQDAEVKQKIKQEIYWENTMNPDLEKKIEMQRNPVSESVVYGMYKDKSQKHQSANEVPREKPTLLEIMERFKGKNLFPEATDRARTYLEKMGFNNMPHPNPMPPIAVTQEETDREALMSLLKGQIDDIKNKGV